MSEDIKKYNEVITKAIGSGEKEGFRSHEKNVKKMIYKSETMSRLMGMV